MIDDEDDEQLELFDAPAPPKKRQVNAKMRRSFTDVDPEQYAAKRVVRHRRQRFIRWLRLLAHRCASCGGPVEPLTESGAKRARPPKEESRVRPERWWWLTPKERGEAPASVVGTCEVEAASCAPARAERIVHRDIKPDSVLVGSLPPRSSGACVVWRAELRDPPEFPKTCARCLSVDSAYKKSSVIVAATALYRDELGRPMPVRGTPRMLPVFGQRYDGDGEGWAETWPVCARLSDCLTEIVAACKPKDPPGASCPKDCAARDVGTPETQMPRRR